VTVNVPGQLVAEPGEVVGEKGAAVLDSVWQAGAMDPQYRCDAQQHIPERDGVPGRKSASGLTADGQSEIGIRWLQQCGRHSGVTTVEEIIFGRATVCVGCSGGAEGARGGNWGHALTTGVWR
jgi:hypothetical protein